MVGERAVGEGREHHWRIPPGLLVSLTQAWQALPFPSAHSGVTGQTLPHRVSGHSMWSFSFFKSCWVSLLPAASCLWELQGPVPA